MHDERANYEAPMRWWRRLSDATADAADALQLTQQNDGSLTKANQNVSSPWCCLSVALPSRCEAVQLDHQQRVPLPMQMGPQSC